MDFSTIIRRIEPHLEAASLVIAFAWCEIAFKAATAGMFWPQLIFILLFSTAAGLFARLLCSFFPTQYANKIAKSAIMSAVGTIFVIEYFVYREFKLYYDPITVTMGAGDAASGFGDRISSILLSPAGIAHLALFMAPSIVYALWGNGEVLRAQERGLFGKRMRMVRDAVVVQIVALLAVSTIGTFHHSYTDQYSFQSAVTNFGLMTAMRKEIQTLAAGSSKKVNFTDTQAQTPTATDSNAEAANTTPQAQKTYPKNVLDIDFAQLATTTEGTWADLDTYVASLAPSSQNDMTGRFKGYNLIFVSAEAFSAEAIREDTTPTLWRMAHNGIQFTDYYQFDTAGTTGGECANIFGLLATEGGNSVKGTYDHNNYYTMGSALGRLGYNGWAFHNNTYTYYSRDLTHNNLGYSNGFMGYGNGMEQWVEWQWPQSDLEMVQGTFDNLYGDKANEPFNVYYMSVSGHSGYAPGENAMSEKHWDAVANLPYSDRVKGYLACNMELDAAMDYLIKGLEKLRIASRTVIVIAADHFPYGLDDDAPLGALPYTSELYGYDVDTYFQRDHNRLIIWSKGLEKEKEPIVVDKPTSAIDVLPTLLNLFGCEWDSRLLPGRDVFSDKPALVFDLTYDWKSELGTYYANSGEFVPNEGAQIPEGYVEATSTDVANRISYCSGVLTSDYYRHVFGE